MAFAVFADGTANLPGSLTEGITLLPFDIIADGQPRTYRGNIDTFDAHAYYTGLKNGKTVQTSLLNVEMFLSRFTPVLEQGTDIIYISMSSSISGTYNAARSAANELMEQFGDRFVHVVDSLGCGFGSGMLAIRAAELSRQGVDAREAAAILEAEVPFMCQYFTVDDLNFLRRTGRVKEITAGIGTILNIKPILFGDAEGRIVSCAKVRGRRKAVEALAGKYEEKRAHDGDQKVFISHGDCPKDAEMLSDLIRMITPDVSLTVCQHEPVSGSHVGPGMLGLFFRGVER